MSTELYSQEQIVNHLENHSPTKYMYSFGKAERFPPIKRRGFSDNFYDLPSQKMRRTAGFGYGTKYDFTKGKGWELTTVKRDFDKDSKPRAPAYSFGLSRDAYRKAYCPGYKNEDKCIPGAAKYNFLKTFGSEAPKYTMRRKDIASVGRYGDSNTPGPGAYAPVVKINDKGIYPISRISNVKCNNFGLDKSQRYNFAGNKNPGPNAYACKSLMGFNFNSKYKSGNMITMSPKYNTINSNDRYPGPGQYLRFSEFGILVSKKYKEKGYTSDLTEPNKGSKSTANFKKKNLNINTEGDYARTDNANAKTKATE